MGGGPLFICFCQPPFSRFGARPSWSFVHSGYFVSEGADLARKVASTLTNGGSLKVELDCS